MSEELFMSVPDVNAYLRRIGIDQPASSLTPDKALLDRLVLAHHLHVPFEDLDLCLLHRPINLGIPALFDKIVTHRRGGYCFEMNALFTQLLTDLGFETRGILCRTMPATGLTEPRPCLHRGILVKLDGQWQFCDVGYGSPMAPGGVPLQDGFDGEVNGERFCMDNCASLNERFETAGSYWPDSDVDNSPAAADVGSDAFRISTPHASDWWLLTRITEDRKTGRSVRKCVTLFNTFAQSNADFLPANMFCTSEQSIFAKRMLLNFKTADGHVSISGDQFTIEKKGKKNTLTLSTEDEYKVVFERYFGICL